MSEAAKTELDQTITRMFDEAQNRLAPELRCATDLEHMCQALYDGYTCTLVKGHQCGHASHGRLGTIVYRVSPL
jgi:hypothetical protein